MTEPNGDGTFKLTTTVLMRFKRRDDGEKFRCIVQPRPGRGDKVIKDRTVFVRCKSFSCVKIRKRGKVFLGHFFFFITRNVL